MWGEDNDFNVQTMINTAYVDYMDLAVRCSRKAVKLNHSLTHSMPYIKILAINQVILLMLIKALQR